MRLTTLMAGAALVALCAGPAAAASKAGGTYAPPERPIPYAQLDSYLKASMKERASRDWWTDAALAANAETGAQANVSATTPDTSATSPMTVNPAPGTPNATPTAPVLATPPVAPAPQ